MRGFIKVVRKKNNGAQCSGSPYPILCGGLVRLEIIAVLLIVHLLYRFCRKNLKK